ncbi:MAG: AraC family transcriptional regulator [Motiliproteus sp.]
MKQDQSVFLKRCDSLPFVEMRRADRSSACYHTHSHDQFSFGVIDAGRADYHNRQHSRLHTNRIGAGTTVTINPADAHSCNPLAGSWSYRMLFIDSHWIGELQQQMFDSQRDDYRAFPHLFRSDTASYQGFSQLFQNLLSEPDPLTSESLLIEFLAQQFLPPQADLSQHLSQHQPQQRATNPRQHGYGVRQIRELIMDQLDSNLSLEQFSAHSGLSRYHLIRSFKQAYGQSPHAFQLNQRINQAKTLLQQGQSLTDTAAQLGFADQSHFQRNFKKRMAVTPKQYQAFFV